jgi:hypothetical protein
MSNIWVHRLTPTLFTAKVMELAPRIAGNSKLKNMMRLSLYEILRKICTAIVSKRNSAVGLNYEVLYPDQCGYVPPQLLHRRSKLPAAMQDGLRRVCAVKVHDYVEADVTAAIEDPITFQDFNESLNAISNGGAPGPSDATANMVKAWAPKTRQLVYDHISYIWVHRTIPKWFKNKIIKLAPKISDNSELKNMRPISLYEVVRKTWTTIISKQIHLVWHNHEVLHSGQYGYRLDNGTPMALLNVVNEIERAIHNKETKHITFWDTRRAFDSILRNLQKLAWVTLGVPHNVAEWFDGLDDEWFSFLSTPLYHQNKKLMTAEELMQTDEAFNSSDYVTFQAEHGIGQGKIANSLM